MSFTVQPGQVTGFVAPTVREVHHDEVILALTPLMRAVR